MDEANSSLLHQILRDLIADHHATGFFYSFADGEPNVVGLLQFHTIRSQHEQCCSPT